MTAPPLLEVPPKSRLQSTARANSTRLAKTYKRVRTPPEVYTYNGLPPDSLILTYRTTFSQKGTKETANDYLARLAGLGHGSLSTFTLPSPVPHKFPGKPSSHILKWRKKLVWVFGFRKWTLRPEWKNWRNKDHAKIAAARRKAEARRRTPAYVEKHRTYRLRKVPTLSLKLDSKPTVVKEVPQS